MIVASFGTEDMQIQASGARVAAGVMPQQPGLGDVGGGDLQLTQLTGPDRAFTPLPGLGDVGGADLELTQLAGPDCAVTPFSTPVN